MSFHVYAIESASGAVYVGHAEDVSKRLAQHNAGRVGSTKTRRPWSLVKTQAFATRSKARWFEKQLKESRGRREKWLRHA